MPVTAVLLCVCLALAAVLFNCAQVSAVWPKVMSPESVSLISAFASVHTRSLAGPTDRLRCCCARNFGPSAAVCCACVAI